MKILKRLGNIALILTGSLLLIVLLFFAELKISNLYYSSHFVNEIDKVILTNDTILQNRISDTIIVSDYDYHECSKDDREFIDKKYTRPIITRKLNNLGYKTIYFEDYNENVKVNNSQPIGISSTVINKKYPSYNVHVWTSTTGLVPTYRIEIEETYYNLDTLIKVTSNYEMIKNIELISKNIEGQNNE